MKEKIESVFNALQQLDIRPTVANTQKLLQCYANLQELYAMVSSLEKQEEVNTDGNTDNG